MQGYRRLIRSVNKAFKGDAFAITSARAQLRDEFMKNRFVSNKADLEELARGIDEVDEMLRFHIVQGRLNPRGNFDVSLDEEHSVTVEAGQALQHGPELTIIDRSILGEPIQMTKTKKK